MHHDDLKDKTTCEIKNVLKSTQDINQLASVCMALCDRIINLEKQVGKLEAKESSQTEEVKHLPENKEKNITGLKEGIREALMIAEKQDTTGEFNPMSWMDLELENTESFDPFFDRAWDQLSAEEQEKRTTAIRRLL
jgi:hypothetical protein